jgi:hypothetical protein
MEPFTSTQDNEAVGKFDDAEQLEYNLDVESGTPLGDILAAVDKVGPR